MKIFKNIQLIVVGVLTVSTYSQAQLQEVIADYPLIEDLVDITGNNNDVFLEGNPNTPSLPTSGTSLCSNGIYIIDPDGQNIETPIMPFFDINNFTIEVDFKVTQLPGANDLRPRMPIIMGSRFARWLGIYIDSSGVMGFKFNNDVNNYRWSNTSLPNLDDWYSSKISYVNGDVELYLNDILILTDKLPPLNTFQNTFNFSVTDFSEGNPLNGCIRNLIISSTPDVVFKSSFE
ncbi:MAG: hypothetical protein AB8B80_00120 [Marinicellaceae bacterium]